MLLATPQARMTTNCHCLNVVTTADTARKETARNTVLKVIGRQARFYEIRQPTGSQHKHALIKHTVRLRQTERQTDKQRNAQPKSRGRPYKYHSRSDAIGPPAVNSSTHFLSILDIPSDLAE